jgi:hypothetical protein
MPTTYTTARANSSSGREVFDGADAVLILDDGAGTVDVIAVFSTLTNAQAAATALNGA